MMSEEWATLTTNVQYGRRRPGWPLDYRLLDQQGELSDERGALSLRIQPST